MCFNSTMVRLKSSGVEFEADSLMCFNSTMVRLKSVSGLTGSIFTEFQFHYGSIKINKNSQTTIQPEVSIPLWFD